MDDFEDFDIELTDQQIAYLNQLLAGETTVKHAAIKAGIHPLTPFAWRRKNEDFAELESICMQLSFDDVQKRVAEFAMDGIPVMMMAGGAPVWKIDPNTGEYALDENFERIPMHRREHKVEYAKLILQAGGRTGQGSEKIGIGVQKGDDGTPDTITVNIVRPDPSRFDF